MRSVVEGHCIFNKLIILTYLTTFIAKWLLRILLYSRVVMVLQVTTLFPISVLFFVFKYIYNAYFNLYTFSIENNNLEFNSVSSPPPQTENAISFPTSLLHNLRSQPWID